MDRITLKIDGMVCSMCEAHICDAIRKAVPAAKKVTASRSRKEASFLTGTPVDPELLTSAVNATGYSCLSVTAEPFGKRGLFGWR
jgi:copper chaperone CopZ